MAKRIFGRATAAAVAAANADITVPAGETWRVFGVSVHVVNDAGVAARLPHVELVISGTVRAGVASVVPAAAGETVLFNFGAGVVASAAQVPAASGTVTDPMPVFVAEAGDVIRGRLVAGQGADAINVFAHFEREVAI